MRKSLTRRQQEIYTYLLENLHTFPYPPTLDELCISLGLSSKGSLHKQIQALIDNGLVESTNNRRRGIRLTEQAIVEIEQNEGLPFFGYIAAGQPIEAVEQQESIQVPAFLHTDGPCYVLQVKGDSMINEGILDGDQIIIEQRDYARNGEIVVALIDGADATLKRIEQKQGVVTLHPANASQQPMRFRPDQVRIQGILVGQMRSYH